MLEGLDRASIAARLKHENVLQPIFQ